ncbi:MAG: hypothetical protein NTV97_16495 [Alphaproteobacteria bacterium]|nr:hypothetical protein [Alphaproteobacteria bacterium]
MARARTMKPKKPAAAYCSFCRKSQHEVATLTAAPGGVAICNECVEICTQCLAGRPPAVEPFSGDLPTEQLLEQLRSVETTLQGKGNQLQRMVEQLRARKVSWAHIGAALGISRQSAWERFT